jgi:hypothetical protein
MAPQALWAGPGQRAGRGPLYDVHPLTGFTIEMFYADRTKVRRWVVFVASQRLLARGSGHVAFATS